MKIEHKYPFCKWFIDRAIACPCGCYPYCEAAFSDIQDYEKSLIGGGSAIDNKMNSLVKQLP